MSPVIEQTAHQASGACRVRYEFCASFIIATLRWRSAVYDTRDPWHRLRLGLPFALASLLLGPWGVPWGPVWTAVAVWRNLTGGVPADDCAIEAAGAELSGLPRVE